MFDNRPYTLPSDKEREETQRLMGQVCFGFLAVVALVVQLIGGFMVAWTVMGSLCLLLVFIIGYTPETDRQNRF